MHSEDKFWAIFWVSAAGLILAIGAMMYSYSVQSIPLESKRIQVEAQLKSECIRNRGIWQSVNHNNSSPYGCSFQ